MRKRIITVASTALAATLLLAGCAQQSGGDMEGMPGMDKKGSSSSSDAKQTGDFNAADEMFATMMIPHHQQAIEMSDMVLAKDGIDPEVVSLAEQIKAAQGPEIEQMKSWLKDWGSPYEESGDGMSGMAGMGDDGMMSEADMSALEAASGPEATRLFLEGMIVHHQGAISMAQDELDSGKNADALEVAQQVIDGQSAEIKTMQGILARL